jgi:two-component system, OmpR family, sensor histidine kinase ChvG
MVQDTASTQPEGMQAKGRLTSGMPLGRRILLVNILPLGLLTASFFYLDGFRGRLIAERQVQAESEARLISESAEERPNTEWPGLVARLGAREKIRIRIIDPVGDVVADSWKSSLPTYTLRDPALEGWQRQFARGLDEAVDLIVDANVPAQFVNDEGNLPRFSAGSRVSLAPDRTHMVESRADVEGHPGFQIVTLRNARDIRRLVRAERSQLGLIIGTISTIAILLSLFLARTIVVPLQTLARAAEQVRFGRAREVDVPRLPDRGDEIGQLSRAVSDMSIALRARVDAVEQFAADVAHELKNPLASLASAVEALASVRKPEQRDQLQAIIKQDVRRLDRLITDISDLSRIDARISRARFQKVDLSDLIEAQLAERASRQRDAGVSIAFAKPAKGVANVHGDPNQLERVFANLIDNAVSFSPAKGTVRISATRAEQGVIVTVDDDGPGVPNSARTAVFERFHSDRPAESFGKHSGLGLSIARTIVEAHGGSIAIVAKTGGVAGACFQTILPAANMR